MQLSKDSRKLADYISSIPNFLDSHISVDNSSFDHIGALFADVVLQAGLNYNSVVRPRVQNILTTYANNRTISSLMPIISNLGLQQFLSWTHPIKLQRFELLLNYAISKEIETCTDLRLCLGNQTNCRDFLSMKGFGPKSLDYLLKLLSVDTVAVDRHIISFLKMAQIDGKGYYEMKQIVEYAADFLGFSRSVLDKLLWNYMSKRTVHLDSLALQPSLFMLDT